MHLGSVEEASRQELVAAMADATVGHTTHVMSTNIIIIAASWISGENWNLVSLARKWEVDGLELFFKYRYRAFYLYSFLIQ